jgi:hypothetical protein
MLTSLFEQRLRGLDRPSNHGSVAFWYGFKLPDVLTTGGKMDLKVSLPLRIVLTREIFPEMGPPALTAH